MDNLQINNVLIANISQLSDFAKQTGYIDIAKTANKIISDVQKQTFSIAVVGEFSRGKSSLINKLLGKEILPVGNLPTTAMLTSIKYGYGENDVLRVLNYNNEQLGKYSVSRDIWNKICDNKTPDDLVNEKTVVTLNIPWLQEAGIEIIDTPGAGDLEDARAKVIGDALISCDAAIIVISATSPFSLSEKLFIEQRLITNKVPFLMVVITKLDLVEEDQRSEVIDYIKSKLQTLNSDLPLFISDETYKTDDFDSNYAGIDKIKKQIISWKNNPERKKLTEQSIAAKAFSLLNILKETLKEKKALIDKDDNEIKKEIENKKLQIMQNSLIWEDLRLKLDEKADECTDFIYKQMSEYKDDLIENLRISLYDTKDIKEWVKNVYPNKTRIELTIIASKLNSDLRSRIAKDKEWFLAELMKQFKIQANKDISLGSIIQQKANTNSFEAIFEEKEKNDKTKIMEGLCGAALALGIICFVPIPKTIPLTCIIAKSFQLLSSKIRDQMGDVSELREKIWKVILEEEIPNIIDNATRPTNERIKAIYRELANESEKQERLWRTTQEQLVTELTNKVNTNGVDTYVDIIDFVKLSTQFKAYITEK